MGIATKGRRRIIVEQATYVWYVAEDVDAFPETVQDNRQAVNIVSEDKRFIVRYHLGQAPSDRRHITVLGAVLEGSCPTGTWRRFRCPAWCDDGIVRPAAVREIIEWCLDKTRPLVEVDYRGEAISTIHGIGANGAQRS